MGILLKWLFNNWLSSISFFFLTQKFVLWKWVVWALVVQKQNIFKPLFKTQMKVNSFFFLMCLELKERRSGHLFPCYSCSSSLFAWFDDRAVSKWIQSCSINRPREACWGASAHLAGRAVVAQPPGGPALMGFSPWTRVDPAFIKLQNNDPNQHGILFPNLGEQSFLLN